MAIWKTAFTLEGLNSTSKDTIGELLGMEFTAFGDDYLEARMPVDSRTMQPARILHGGASVVLAETLGSVASFLCIDTSRYSAVGLEVNANHLRAVSGGYVTGTVRPVRIGRTIHVWNIELHDDKGRLNCVSRLTMAIIDKH